jgi:hypothetical protein
MVVFSRFPKVEETPSSQRVMTFLAGFEFVLYRAPWENEKTDTQNICKSLIIQSLFNMGKRGKTWEN